MEVSQRLHKIPPYLFAEINKKITEAKKRGVDVISLGIGDPDMPTPQPIIDELIKEANNPKNHQYPDYEGLLAFRTAVSKWYKKRHNVSLDPEEEVLTLIGAKEGSVHLSIAFLNPGEVALIPSPGYTVYKTAAIMADAEPYEMPLLEKNGFLPDLQAVPKDIVKKAKLLYLNYPNNPTGAVADKDFYKEVIDFAKENEIIVCSDNPYSETGYDGYKPLSFLEIYGAKEVGIELNSLSKPYNMTGWRIGMAVGNADIIRGIGISKSNTDSGVFNAIQYAAIKAMSLPDSHIENLMKIYQKRRDLVISTLKKIGLKPFVPKAAFYIWTKVPAGETSASFATKVLEKAGVVITPGAGYGKTGEGYFRISLTVPDGKLKEAMQRIEKVLL
ncbi:MAG TPA: LL-diaminopimelate aminotransferase [Candidatus Nanoarchaeia archaeon]|nr:LL-diaminopimelate aminotransferase [Candidatus Nanoarchaeia archaeon]